MDDNDLLLRNKVGEEEQYSACDSLLKQRKKNLPSDTLVFSIKASYSHRLIG
jgi:hypothetical protein